MKIQKDNENVLLLDLEDVTALYNYFKKTVSIPVAYPKEPLGFSDEYRNYQDVNMRFLAALRLIVDKE